MRRISVLKFAKRFQEAPSVSNPAKKEAVELCGTKMNEKKRRKKNTAASSSLSMYVATEDFHHIHFPHPRLLRTEIKLQKYQSLFCNNLYETEPYNCSVDSVVLSKQFVQFFLLPFLSSLPIAYDGENS